MAEQPSYRPLAPSDFFPDGRSARPLQPGTIARGQLRDDQLLFAGRENSRRGAVAAGSFVGLGSFGPWAVAGNLELSLQRLAVADYATTFPFPVTEAVLYRGQERYTIFCAICHDATGNGRGTIVQRGYTQPPSYITDPSRGFERRGIKILLRDVPVGYYFEVVSKGYGAMSDYATQVPPQDRWAIIAHIRALQLSQYARLDDLPDGERANILKKLEERP